MCVQILTRYETEEEGMDWKDSERPGMAESKQREREMRIPRGVPGWAFLRTHHQGGAHGAGWCAAALGRDPGPGRGPVSGRDTFHLHP